MKVVAIHLAPATRLPVRAVESVDAEAGKGLVGGRYHRARHRHVTIQSQEFLARAAEDLGYTFDCGATRRNVTVDSGEIPTQPARGCASGVRCAGCSTTASARARPPRYAAGLARRAAC